MILTTLAIGAGEDLPVDPPPLHVQVRSLRSVMRSAVAAELADLDGQVERAGHVAGTWVSEIDPGVAVGPIVTIRAPPDASRALVARVERLQAAAVAWGDIAASDAVSPQRARDAAWSLVAIARGDRDRVSRWRRMVEARCAIRAL